MTFRFPLGSSAEKRSVSCRDSPPTGRKAYKVLARIQGRNQRMTFRADRRLLKVVEARAFRSPRQVFTHPT